MFEAVTPEPTRPAGHGQEGHLGLYWGLRSGSQVPFGPAPLRLPGNPEGRPTAVAGLMLDRATGTPGLVHRRPKELAIQV